MIPVRLPQGSALKRSRRGLTLAAFAAATALALSACSGGGAPATTQAPVASGGGGGDNSVHDRHDYPRDTG